MATETTAQQPSRPLNQMRRSTHDAQLGQGNTDLEVMTSQISDAVMQYGKKQPGVVACMVFAAGFFVGWKIKPW